MILIPIVISALPTYSTSALLLVDNILDSIYLLWNTPTHPCVYPPKHVHKKIKNSKHVKRTLLVPRTSGMHAQVQIKKRRRRWGADTDGRTATRTVVKALGPWVRGEEHGPRHGRRIMKIIVH